MSAIDDLRAAVIAAARSHRPTTVRAYAPACVDMECGHDPYRECPLVDVEVCAACTAVSEDRDPEEWLLVSADCPVCVAVVELEAAEAITEQWKATYDKGRIEVPVPPSREPTAPNPMVMEKRPRRSRSVPSYEALALVFLALSVAVLALVLAVTS